MQTFIQSAKRHISAYPTWVLLWQGGENEEGEEGGDDDVVAQSQPIPDSGADLLGPADQGQGTAH